MISADLFLYPRNAASDAIIAYSSGNFNHFGFSFSPCRCPDHRSSHTLLHALRRENDTWHIIGIFILLFHLFKMIPQVPGSDILDTAT